ncbi:hypothetical protein Tcan_14419 [Toxocara canis]|uniref:Uncharacterized protein n=1 Tax=Toxocara canis TaxID=6265 RepID=A0A0B2V1Q9_TOXCA|nr:hypothetical protein Tcan_14419 [Toxocara canis]
MFEIIFGLTVISVISKGFVILKFIIAVVNRDYDHGDSLAPLDGRKKLAVSAEPARSGNRRITSGNEETSDGNGDGNDGRKGKLHKGIEAKSETTDGKKGGVGPEQQKLLKLHPVIRVLKKDRDGLVGGA